MTSQSLRRVSSKIDQATDYARGVVEGKYEAGPLVRGAARRHLEDLEKGNARGLWFDAEAAQWAIEFFSEVLTVEKDNQTVPFHLEPWQAFVVGSLFGWMRGENRRFQTAYIETGKGSGKSPLAAGVGHYCFVADGVKRAEVYAAATKKDQAMILYRDAVAMVENSPILKQRIEFSGRKPVWNMANIASGSFFRPISSDDGQSGPRPNCALVDEYHEHKTAEVLEMLERGFKGRRNPLLFVITNSGSDKQTPCGDMHDWAAKVSLGNYDEANQDAADQFFAYVCALDEGDDPLTDPDCWGKVNPSLGVTIDRAYLEKAVADARAMPSKQNRILRLNFCVWTDSADAWVRSEAWTACEDAEVTWEAMRGRECYAGLDLSFTKDLTALALVFPRGNEFDAIVEFWKPKVGLREQEDADRVPYTDFAEAGEINLTEGRVIKLEPVARRLGEVADAFDLRVVAYDKYRHKELADDMMDLGIELPMTEHPQGFRRTKDSPLWMPESCQELENAVSETRLRVGINRMLRSCVASVVVRPDPAGTDNFIFDKRKSTKRIDGVVALAMGVGAAKESGRLGTIKSPWEDPEAVVELL